MRPRWRSCRQIEWASLFTFSLSRDCWLANASCPMPMWPNRMKSRLPSTRFIALLQMQHWFLAIEMSQSDVSTKVDSLVRRVCKISFDAVIELSAVTSSKKQTKLSNRRRFFAWVEFTIDFGLILKWSRFLESGAAYNNFSWSFGRLFFFVLCSILSLNWTYNYRLNLLAVRSAADSAANPKKWNQKMRQCINFNSSTETQRNAWKRNINETLNAPSAGAKESFLRKSFLFFFFAYCRVQCLYRMCIN